MMSVSDSIRSLRFKGWDISLVGGIVYENDPTAMQVSHAIVREPLHSLYHHVHSVTEFSQNVQSMTIFPDFTYLATQGSPCTKISGGIFMGHTSASSLVGPHAFPSSLIWDWHHGLVLLDQRCAPGQLISISEMTPTAVHSWHHELERALGKATTVEATSREAARTRSYYTVPALLSVPAPDVPEGNANQFSDGSVWPVNYGTATFSPTASPPTLRTIYPYLLQKNATNTISAADKATIMKFRYRDKQGHFLFAGVTQLAHWLGLGSTAIYFLHQLTNCLHLPIDPEFGMTFNELSTANRPTTPQSWSGCGVLRLCCRCSATCNVLGRAWSLPSSTNIIYHTLLEALKPQPATHPVRPRFFASQPRHLCDLACTLAVNLEQAKVAAHRL
jgi:hypothetical protein